MKHYHIVITDDNDTNPVLLEQSQSLRLLLNHLKTAGSGVDKLIGSMLLTLGIPASLNGYLYLCEAVRLVMESSDFMKPITRKLYPAIAAEFGTSPGRAERCIRHAIKVAWQRGKVERLNALLGFVVLFIFNFFGEFIGISIPINLISSLITGFFGVPGVVFLILYQILF